MGNVMGNHEDGGQGTSVAFLERASFERLKCDGLGVETAGQRERHIDWPTRRR